MTIETKFSVRDTIFFLYSNKIVEDTIYSIEVNKYFDNSGSTKYTTSTHYKGNRLEFREDENCLFSTKEELLNSL